MMMMQVDENDNNNIIDTAMENQDQANKTIPPTNVNLEISKVLSFLIENIEEGNENIENNHESDSDDSDDSDDDDFVPPNYEIGMTVRVDSRTWPGINKHGGVGTIKKISFDEKGKVFLDVKYILGGMEKKLQAKYVHPEDVINNTSKRAHHQRTLYDPATGLQWEPSNDLSKVKHRLEYLQALEEERKRYLAQQNGGQAVVEEEIIDSSSSDEDEELNLLDFKKLKQYQPTIANNTNDNEKQVSKEDNDDDIIPELVPQQNINEIQTNDSDDDDDIPLHKRRKVTTEEDSSGSIRGTLLATINAPITTTTTTTSTTITNITTSNNKSITIDLSKAPTNNKTSKKRKLKTNEIVKKRSSKNNGEEDQFVLGYDTDPDKIGAHPTLTSEVIRNIKSMKPLEAFEEALKLGNWFEKKVKILQDKVTNLDNYRYGSDKYSIKWKKRDKTLKDLRVRGVDRIRELLKRADKSERVQNSPKYFIFDKKFQDLRDEISSIKKRLDRCFELHADKIQKENIRRFSLTQNDESDTEDGGLNNMNKRTRRNNNRRERRTRTTRNNSQNNSQRSKRARNENSENVGNSNINNKSKQAKKNKRDTAKSSRRSNHNSQNDDASNEALPSQDGSIVDLLHSNDDDNNNNNNDNVATNSDNVSTIISSFTVNKNDEYDDINSDKEDDVEHNVGQFEMGVENEPLSNFEEKRKPFYKTFPRKYVSTLSDSFNLGKNRNFSNASEIVKRVMKLEKKSYSNELCGTIVLFKDIHVNLELTSFIPFHGTMGDLFEKIGVATKEMEEIQLFHMKSNEATPGYTISKANDYKSSCLKMYETLTHLFLNKLPSQEYNTFASKLIECFYKFEHIASFNLTLKRLASLLHGHPENTLELENGLLENIRNVLHGRIEFYCFLIKWVSRISSNCKSLYVNFTRSVIRIVVLAMHCFPETLFSQNIENNCLIDLTSCLLLFQPIEQGTEAFNFWDSCLSYVIQNDLKSNSIFSNFEQIDDTQILNWLKNGQRKPNIQPGNHWLGSEVAMEICWGVGLYFFTIDNLLSNDMELSHHYKQLNNVHYWDVVSKLSENWVAFNAMSINDENEHESKFFQLYHNFDANQTLRLPCPFDAAWNYTHKICKRVLYFTQISPCQTFSNTGDFKHLFLLSFWQAMYQNVWNLNIGDMMEHHGCVCHVQKPFQPCLVKQILAPAGSIEAVQNAYCNNVFPNIPTSKHASLCCSSFPPFLVNYLNPADFTDISQYAEGCDDHLAHAIGDSSSTLICKSILQHFFKLENSLKQAMLTPFFQMLHKFKSPATLIYNYTRNEEGDLKNGNDPPRVVESNKCAGTLQGFKSLIELILTVLVACSQDQMLLKLYLSTLVKTFSKLLNISASDPEARAIYMQGFSIFIAILHKSRHANQLDLTSSMKKCGKFLIKMITLNMSDLRSSYETSSGSDDTNFSMLQNYDRFLCLARLQVDCLWNLIQLGRENYAQQANINIVLQERPNFKDQIFWGLRKHEHEFMPACILEMLKGKLNLIYLDGNCDEMLEGILSLLLRPFVDLWPGELELMDEDFMELDGNVLRLQGSAKTMLRKEVREAILASANVEQYKSIFESLSILILDSNNGNNQNRKLIKAAAAVAAVSLVSDVDLSWWNSIFYTWLCNYIRQTDNSIGTHRLNPSFFLSNIFLSRGFFITNCNNNNNNTPNIMNLIFQNKKEYSQILFLMIQLIFHIVFEIQETDLQKKDVCIKGIVAFYQHCKKEQCRLPQHDEVHKVLFGLVSNVCKSWEKKVDRRTLLKSFFCDISDVSNKIVIGKLRDMLRANISALNKFWRKHWEGQHLEHCVKHVYDIVNSILYNVSNVEILCPLLANDNKQIIIEIMIPGFFTDTIFSKTSSNGEKLARSKLPFYQAQKRAGVCAIFDCFSRLQYSTGRHIEKLLRNVISSLFHTIEFNQGTRVNAFYGALSYSNDFSSSHIIKGPMLNDDFEMVLNAFDFNERNPESENKGKRIVPLRYFICKNIISPLLLQGNGRTSHNNDHKFLQFSIIRFLRCMLMESKNTNSMKSIIQCVKPFQSFIKKQVSNNTIFPLNAAGSSSSRNASQISDPIVAEELLRFVHLMYEINRKSNNDNSDFFGQSMINQIGIFAFCTLIQNGENLNLVEKICNTNNDCGKHLIDVLNEFQNIWCIDDDSRNNITGLITKLSNNQEVIESITIMPSVQIQNIRASIVAISLLLFLKREASKSNVLGPEQQYLRTFNKLSNFLRAYIGKICNMLQSNGGSANSEISKLKAEFSKSLRA